MRSRNMTPRPPVDDVENQFLADSKNRREFGAGNNPRAIQTSDFHHLSFRELVLAMKLSFWMKDAAPIHHVAHVLLVSSNIQMRRVATQWIVALVTALKSIWNTPISVLPRKPVSDLSHSRSAAALRVRRESSISPGCFFPEPGPAFVRLAFLNLFPEPLLRWGFGYHNCGEHNSMKVGRQCAA
jgi:hypothetical protein